MSFPLYQGSDLIKLLRLSNGGALGLFSMCIKHGGINPRELFETLKYGKLVKLESEKV